MQHSGEWEIWLNHHLSPVIALWLQQKHGIVAKSSYTLNLAALDDIEIYKLANNNAAKVILISKDADFPTLTNRFGSPPKLINVRIGNTDNKLLFNFISSNLEEALKRLLDDNIDVVELEQ